MKILATGENAYFAASNSASGFHSYYRECFDTPDIGRVYAVKGGPGTGKNLFLRAVAEAAGRVGYEREYVYCSSDPFSLDGVILTRGDARIALVDATAPHVYEPALPGVREELVDLGAFWNAGILQREREEIARWNAEKKQAYRRTYRALSCYGLMNESREELVRPFLQADGLAHTAERLLETIPRGREYRERIALMRSVGMEGEILFDTYFARAKKLYLVEDCRGCARYLMRELLDGAKKKRLSVRLSFDPVLPDVIDAIELIESGTVFAVAEKAACQFPYRRVSVRRFVETGRMKPIRPMLNFTEQMRRSALAGALKSLERVRECHFRLEDLYRDAMDFRAKEDFTARFVSSLFPLQK